MSIELKAPRFWSRQRHPLSFVLAPLGVLYGLGVRLRFALTTPYHSKLPVICVGNFTMGGGGKTPLALEICRLLMDKGHRPVFLTRGYGGEERGPHLVDLVTDNAQMVGDEPLLLAAQAPVVVSADRPAGARLIEQMDADVILMDDGFQNPTLHKDLSILVVDEVRGIGNERVFPAGPLRAPLAFQMKKADLLVIAGPCPEGEETASAPLEREFSGDIFRTDLVAVGNVDWLRGARVLAVTGIARPDKFYGSLQRLGTDIVQMFDYPDHHMFSEQEAKDLLALCKTDEAQIIMTRKDWVRLPQSGQRDKLRAQTMVLDVRMEIDQPKALLKRLEQIISASQAR